MANRVFISGNLGTDIKVTYTAGKGTPVEDFQQELMNTIVKPNKMKQCG